MIDLKASPLLTTEDVNFLTDLANEIRTQNNHGTRAPIFLQVKEPNRTFGMDLNYGSGAALLIGDENEDFYDIAKAKAYLVEHYSLDPFELKGLDDFEEMEAICFEHSIPANCTGYLDEYEYHEFFLTHSGFEKHMEMNRHNYRDDSSFYVRHLWRNPELERLLGIVDKFATVEVNAK